MVKTPTLPSLIKSKSSSAKNILDAILNDALKKKATNIHLENHSDQVNLRYRINNKLQKIKDLPENWMKLLEEHLEKLANLPIDQALPQEGRFKIKIGKKDINIIASFWPTFEGNKITLKILATNQLNDLALTKKEIEQLQKILKQKNGLILLTQIKLPEKNKILYSLLSEIENEHLDIFTLEDFIEAPLPGIHQQQLTDWQDQKISRHFQQLLRHQPDIVMISKITGPETAKAIVEAAMTDQVIITYLPNSNVKDALEYLLNCGIDPYILENTLKATIFQKNDSLKVA